MRQRDWIIKSESAKPTTRRRPRIEPVKDEPLDPGVFVSDEERENTQREITDRFRTNLERGRYPRGVQVARRASLRKMAPGKKNEKHWQKAKESVSDQVGKPESKFTDRDWQHVNGVYTKIEENAKKAMKSKWTGEEIPEDATCSDCGHYIHVPRMKSGGKCRIKGMQMGRSGSPAARDSDAAPCEAFAPRAPKRGGSRMRDVAGGSMYGVDVDDEEELDDYDGDAKNEPITLLPEPKRKAEPYRPQPGEEEYNKARQRGENPPHYFWQEGVKVSQRTLANSKKKASIWDRIVELSQKVKEKIIKSWQDFAGVAKRNGFIVIEPGSGTMAGVEAVVRHEDEERGRWLEVEKKDYERSKQINTYDPAAKGEDWSHNPDLLPEARIMLSCEDLLKSGNLKIDKKTGVWTLPCWRTCPESTDFCHEFCYARKAEAQYPEVINSRVKKLKTSRDPAFVDIMTRAIEQTGFNLIRIHESGDFYNKEYFEKWMNIARALPGVQFYAFTKAYKLLDEYNKDSDKPDNMVFNGSLEVSTEVPTRLMEVTDEDGKRHTKTLEHIKQFFSGSTQEKIQSFLKNPNVAGLAMVIPRSASIEDTLWALGLDQAVQPDEVFICPYKTVINGVDQGCGPLDKGLCPFCWLPAEERLSGYGARHVAFHQH